MARRFRGLARFGGLGSFLAMALYEYRTSSTGFGTTLYTGLSKFSRCLASLLLFFTRELRSPERYSKPSMKLHINFIPRGINTILSSLSSKLSSPSSLTFFQNYHLINVPSHERCKSPQEIRGKVGEKGSKEQGGGAIRRQMRNERKIHLLNFLHVFKGVGRET